MNIIIKVIPHRKQRYETAGDWFWKRDTLHIRVSSMGDWRYEALVAVHELVEVLLCEHDGVTQKEVDKFDIGFEKSREPDNTDEPGDETCAPYVAQHCIATGVERILAALLGVKWKVYESTLNAL